MRHWRTADWLIVAFLLFLDTVVIYPQVTQMAERRAHARCYRWLSAASTPRDTLWVTVLRPECAALLPPRMP